MATQLKKSCRQNLELLNIETYGTHIYQCTLESFKRVLTNKQRMLRCVTSLRFAQMETEFTHSKSSLFIQEMLIYGYTSSDTWMLISKDERLCTDCGHAAILNTWQTGSVLKPRTQLECAVTQNTRKFTSVVLSFSSRQIFSWYIFLYVRIVIVSQLTN